VVIRGGGRLAGRVRAIQKPVSSRLENYGRDVRLRLGTALVLMAVLALLETAGPAAASSSSSTAAEPPGTPVAHSFRGMSTVGPLFRPDSSVHTCTASVVDSAKGDVLITAAHCISGTGAGYTFAPGYHDGIEPFGIWSVVDAYGARGWLAKQAPQRDFAFLVVAPRRHNGHLQRIEQVTGANRLGTAPVSGEQVTVPAYATGHDDNPITCTTRVRYDGKFPAFNCNPYVDGTSGSPWLHRTGKSWEVVGIIGGPNQGGCNSWTSYSARFGRAALRVEFEAASGFAGSTFPTPGSDGCTTTT
jgi:hypothetical protein